MSAIRDLLRTSYPERRALVNVPVGIDAGAYAEAERAYVDMVSELPEFRALYRGGRIEHPGISDLDLVVVTADSLQGGRAALFGADRLDPRYRRVHVHDPFPIGVSRFGEVTRATSLKDLAWVAGSELDGAALEDARDAAHRVFQLSSEIVLSLPREFLDALASPTLDVRHLLMRLGSLRYPLAIARESLGVEFASGEAYAARVRDFRSAALVGAGVTAGELVELLEDAVGVSLELIAAVSAALAGERWAQDGSDAGNRRFRGWFLDETFPTLFVPAWMPESALADMLALRVRSGHPVSILPDTLWPFVAITAMGDGPVARHIAARLRPVRDDEAPRASREYEAALRAGAAFRNARSRWLEQNGFQFGYTHTFGWRPAASIRWRVRRTLRGWVLRVAAPPRIRTLRRLPVLAEAA